MQINKKQDRLTADAAQKINSWNRNAEFTATHPS